MFLKLIIKIYYKGSIRKPGDHNIENIKKDLGGENVLISNSFFYFGENHIDIPFPSLKKEVIKLTRSHKYKGLEKKGERLIQFLGQNYKRNKLYGMPVMYETTKSSCRTKKNRVCYPKCA